MAFSIINHAISQFRLKPKEQIHDALIPINLAHIIIINHLHAILRNANLPVPGIPLLNKRRYHKPFGHIPMQPHKERDSKHGHK